ncbi:MAG: large conductance mechanosensitive channel protein MscL [Firmicutes bacterium]|nr:large conductance mechanosensitive channel protein MscL [Bacillota bacterium]
MKKFFKEFKEFALTGSVMDMAVGIIIGGALTTVVTSLVNDILNPIIGLFIGENLTDKHAVVLGADFHYGSFIMAVINFIIIALVVFLIVKALNKARNARKEEEPDEEVATTKICPFCKSEIDIDATKCPNCTSDLKE